MITISNSLKMKRIFTIYGILVLPMVFGLIRCTPQKNPLRYGEDKCEYCRMTIVDQRYGCELVTSKGKALKFDATECMLNFLEETNDDETSIKLILTNTIDKPGELVDATKCLYLKSKNLPSPMGAFINPYSNATQAKKAQEQHLGELFQWEELRFDFGKNY